mmetsp:Transcript_7382/g.9361  ORF Transcript_7382/g.9361 Transcript_7382/m.9361 type:complete len:384 (-) Transcript_7382:1070-2221(-)|eukprot:CAMPEP_0204825998 /NCGR_PEP_ID=MMETSP1346-20131115/3767_1 /ASSEMBLY_ACC=CAM_ASM_000771 /TAXON_ID=215587 /ORGANISM="Aplanochytrium stocchinoi, Strain GSBS06" /LENGTH=383 /DNA_ID=CAMNT_0051953821 /DNA_START=413 /DNA_END=1564 /DNA_ORIENTATION=-
MAAETSLELLEDWEEWNPESGTPFYVHALAGSIAGAAEHCAMFPFDTIKTFAQAEGNAGSSNVGDSLRRLVQAEGSFRLWRGVSTMLTGCIPAHAAYFSIYEHGKDVFSLNDPNATHNPLAAATCGSLATIAHDCIMTPMDVIKQRMQLGFGNSIRDCVAGIVKTDGIGGLFRSFPTTLLMNIPYAGIMVATNESVKKILNPSNQYNVGAFLVSGGIAGAVAAAFTNPLDVAKTRLQTQCILSGGRPFENSRSKTHSSGICFCKHGKVSSISKCLDNRGVALLRQSKTGILENNFASYMALCRHKYSGNEMRKGTTTYTSPIERPAPTSGVRYNGLLDALKTIYAEEGAAGFARGLRPRLMVNAPSVAISWTAYETAKSVLAG